MLTCTIDQNVSDTLRLEIERAHQVLDKYGIPREIGPNHTRLSLSARISFLRGKYVSARMMAGMMVRP